MNKPTGAKYHGLINRGATCYLNSVLQVLFMTEEFREAVTSPNEADIDHHLKNLFEDLLQGKADPYRILRALKVNNVYEQQDAAEYFERILRKTSENAAKIFHGQLSHSTTCSTCKVPTESKGPFWHLPLELEDSPGRNYSVENGINKFFTPTEFNGNNQIYCETCDAKVDATRKYVITHHPDVLLLMLKRFDFSYQWMSYIKINCIADVPHTIEIPENQTYELYAVVEHFGDLRGGRYQAVIKSKDEGQWFVFDSSVTQLDKSPFPDNVNVAQSINAYLLFYRKKVADNSISDPNIQGQSPKEENLQPGDETETLNENISDKEGKIDHISTEANPEKREINEAEEINQDEQRLPEEETGREKQTEMLSQDETKYHQDIKKDSEDQEENRHQISGEDQNQKTQTPETEDVDETHVHQDRPKVDEGGKSKQKSPITGKRNRNSLDQGKKENQDNSDRTGEDKMAAYSDSPEVCYDESEEVIKKKHIKQMVQTSHDTQNELDLKKTRKKPNYKMAATLTGNQQTDRDEETRQENFQAAVEHKTIKEDIREFSPGGKGKTIIIKTITEETTTINNSNNRKSINNEGNVDCDLEDGVLVSAKEETTILSEPLLRE